MKKVWGGSGVWLLHIIYSRNGLPLADELTLFLQLRKRSSAVATDGPQVGKQNHTASLLKLHRFYMFFIPIRHQQRAIFRFFFGGNTAPGGTSMIPCSKSAFVTWWQRSKPCHSAFLILFVCWSLFQSFLFYHSLESNLSQIYHSLSYFIMFVTIRMSISLASS